MRPYSHLQGHYPCVVGDERGFTLVEVLVATACAVLLGGVLVAITHALVGWTARTSRTVDAQASLDALTDRWYADAATAWAIFTPANDVLGKSNADGHEFDVVTEDSLRRTQYRAYTFDATAQRVTVYAYGSPGDAPTPTGDAFDNISELAAQTATPSALHDVTSPLYDPLFSNATIAAADVALPSLAPQAIAGNRLTRVHVSANRLDRVAILSAATAPSHYTIVFKYTPAP